MADKKNEKDDGVASAVSAGATGGAQEMIFVRNRFFYIYYRKLSLIFAVALGVCAFSLVSAFYFATRKTPPIYIPVTEDGRLIRTYALHEPSHPNTEIMNAMVKQWVLSGTRRLFTFDYLNYAEQLNGAQQYFTVRGWNNYLRTFRESQNLNTVIAQKMIVNMMPLSPPEILEHRVVDGRLAWALKFPAEIRYIPHDGGPNGSRGNIVQQGVIKVVVLRVSNVDSPKGIGIDQVIFEEKGVAKMPSPTEAAK